MARCCFSALIGAGALLVLFSLAACDMGARTTHAPASFLLTCSRPSSSAMVLRLDTGLRRFTIVNADGAPDGGIAVSPYAYSLTTKAWSGKVNRYDGQLNLVRTPAMPRPAGKGRPPAPAAAEIWSCAMAVDRARF